MLCLLSPAKSLDESSLIDCPLVSEPTFQKEKKSIAVQLKKLSPKDIANAFKLSEKLAELNYQRYQALGSKKSLSKTRQAIFTFNGDVYLGFDAYSLDQSSYDMAQDHIRILSGLYGLLKPFDLIEPYRLEMGSSIAIGRNKNLYSFWDSKVTDALNEDISRLNSPYLLNLASNEYFKVVQTEKINGEVIHFEFLEDDKKLLKNISFYSKKARGLMARFVVEHKINNLVNIKEFDSERYQYSKKLSMENKFVFTRKFQPLGK